MSTSKASKRPICCNRNLQSSDSLSSVDEGEIKANEVQDAEPSNQLFVINVVEISARDELGDGDDGHL